MAHTNRTPVARMTSRKTKSCGKAPSGATGGTKKWQRFRPKPVYVREIRQYEKNTERFIRKLPLSRLLRDVAPERITALWFRREVLLALQAFSESYLVCQFKDKRKCSYHGRRLRLTARDVILARRIRGEERA